MRQVMLFTYRNAYLSGYFSDRDYSLLQYPLPLSLSRKDEIDISCDRGYVVAEVNDLNIKDISGILGKLSQSRKVICIAESVSETLKEILLDRGIIDLIGTRYAARIPDYIDSIEDRDPAKLGRILILEDHKATEKILNEIINRFDYEAIFIDSIEYLSESINKNNIQMILLNLGMEDLNLVKLISMYNSHRRMRDLPVISYKDMDKGIFVHEIISGLNRLTKVILSKEELFSFLVDILFRKKVIPAVEKINSSMKYNETSFFREETLSKLYYNRSEFLFSMTNILSDENIEIILKALKDMEKDFIKIDGLRWLIIDKSRDPSNQCNG